MSEKNKPGKKTFFSLNTQSPIQNFKKPKETEITSSKCSTKDLYSKLLQSMKHKEQITFLEKRILKQCYSFLQG